MNYARQIAASEDIRKANTTTKTAFRAAVAAFLALGAGGSTARAMVEIGSGPYTISSSGSYQLSANITVAGSGTAINITAGNVTLDLNGFTVSSVGCKGGVGIDVHGSAVIIKNGIVSGWQSTVEGSSCVGIVYETNAAGRVYQVTLEGNDIGVLGDSGAVVEVEDSTINFNRNIGVDCGACTESSIINTRVMQNGVYGVIAGTGYITGSQLTLNGKGNVPNTGVNADLYVRAANKDPQLNLVHVTNSMLISPTGFPAPIWQDPHTLVTFGQNTLAGAPIEAINNFDMMNAAGACFESFINLVSDCGDGQTTGP